MDHRYRWDPTTMSITEIMEGSDNMILHHSHRRTGVGRSNHDLNFILQLVRFFNRATTTLSETKILYCGAHGHLVSAVLRYFPTLQLTVCAASEVTQWEAYTGWILIYDYQINYKDVLIASLARRGLTLTDDTGNYVTSYRQAVNEAMFSHREAVKGFLQQQQMVHQALNPVLGLWRFTLPWHEDTAVNMDGEIWPSIWGSANTSYAWLVTAAKSELAPSAATDPVLQIYNVNTFRAILKYYNITLRSRFYQNPVSDDGQPPEYPGLDNSWDSWATVAVLQLLDPRDANELIRTFPPQGVDSSSSTINDPFL